MGLEGAVEGPEIGERLLDREYRNRLHPEAFELIEEHRSLGHTLVIASAATAYQAGPIARAFGIEDVLCTRLETIAGRLTGAVDSTCWSEGKLEAVETIARERGIRLADSYFYSDGLEDLPLLEAVGHPRPTNADERLARVARDRGWELTSFGDSRAPTLWDLARPLIEEREAPDWRERFERALDQPVRMGYRTAHWMRKSIQYMRDVSDRRD